MAYGAAIAGLVASLASTGLSMAGQSAQQAKQNQDVSNELLQQKQLSNKASLVYQNSLSQSTPQAAQQQIAQGQQQANAAYQQAEKVPLSSGTSPVVGNTSINTPDQNARAGVLNNAAAGIKGYGNFDLQQWLKDQSANANLGVIGQQAQQSESILPYELQGAQNPYAGISGALGAFGSLANTYVGLQNGQSGTMNAAMARGNASITNTGQLKPFGASQLIGGF